MSANVVNEVHNTQPAARALMLMMLLTDGETQKEHCITTFISQLS